MTDFRDSDQYIYHLLMEYNKQKKYPLVYFTNLSEFNSVQYPNNGFLSYGEIKESMERLESKGLVRQENRGSWVCTTPHEIAQHKCKTR